jgi:ketosteroid isomerase-like protein
LSTGLGRGAIIFESDQYAISVAKTEFREAYNTADVARLLAVFASEFTDCSEGEPSFYGEEAARALRLRTTELFRHFEVRIQVIIINVVVAGDFAYDTGWHKMFLTNRATGEATKTKYRYFETWKKENGVWRIDYIITNRELPSRMLPEQEHAPAHPASAEEKP